MTVKELIALLSKCPKTHNIQLSTNNQIEPLATIEENKGKIVLLSFSSLVTYALPEG